ncbi:carboxymethylenebutenolidase [Granulicella pectinivorans]|uniref:Carboxymethylenebutenolidase n=1 Tax=Granulicella pectinivorans TaxID=474950 RepID=A0A1I6MSG0_9BACT|nr:dienelactone hydrolase family protein [Granulicella pectinivorans]SFS18683.1 carboxymethylenebutenolidase [Granulicella pectinivorans]
MSEWVNLTAVDGHELKAYVAKPEGTPVGAVVVVQEIFGVNPSIQAVVDGYAKEGFLAIAPALFDRFERDLQLGYGPDDMKKAFDLYAKLDPSIQIKDVAAAFAYVKATAGKVAVTGYCYGGLMTWVSAVRGEALGVVPACAVAYYPGGIGKFATEQPTCPVMLHFGADDDHIGTDQVDAVRNAHPGVEIFTYPGVGHAFANFARSSYNQEAAQIADERTLQFLKTHIS